MDKDTSLYLKSAGKELLEARKELEKLTKSYIENLLASHERAKEHSRLLFTILDSVGDGLLVFDKEGRIILANRAAIELSGMDLNNLSRREFMQTFTSTKLDGTTPVAENEEPYIVALRERRTAELEGHVEGPHLPQGGLWIRASASPVISEDNEILGVVGIYQNITERLRLQKQRDALATVITHDLKNHLIAVDGFLDMLAEKLDSELDPGLKRLLTSIEASNETYLQMAHTLMEIHRADLYAVEAYRADVEVNAVLDSVIQLNSVLASTRSVAIKFTTGKLPLVKGIPSALRQLFHNLLQNAIHVSPKGSSIEIHASTEKESVVVTIQDKGPGLNPADIDNLFDPKRVAVKLTSFASTGFGLYLCRLLVEAHGGQLSCQSHVNEGTLLTVSLPLPKKDEA